MSTNGSTEARKLRSRLDHPVIDADGHWIEYLPVMREEFRRIGGEAAVEALAVATDRVPNALRMSLPERRRRRVGMEAFWSSPSENVLDRATAMLPRLMYERLDDLGIDFCVVYPTNGLGFHRMPDLRLRRAICRAYNVFAADQFRGLGDRVIPAAVIPMYTPEEAIEEMEFASKQLGLKVMMLGGLMRRRVAAVAEEQPDAARFAEWYDVIGIDDSEHDYDPVWAKCLELRVAPSFHNGARSILLRNSPSNFCYNHIGHFASAGHAVAKALFFGPVTRRFPALNFAFLEGGVGWACMLYADLLGHWEKRNRQAIESTNPSKLDRGRCSSSRRSTAGRRSSRPCAAAMGSRATPTRRSPAGSRISTTTSAARSAARATSATSSCRASTSAARPTTRSTRGPSTAAPTQWARASTRSSARTSATSTFRT
jgi:predicted TIM-barrel fold metal-dependent hydrolase